MNRRRMLLLAMTLVTVALVGLLLAASASADPTAPDLTEPDLTNPNPNPCPCSCPCAVPCPCPCAGVRGPITWYPPAVTGVISPGVTFQKNVSFTTCLTITHVRLEVTPPLKFFCEITPTRFSTITPGIMYTVRISCTLHVTTTAPVPVRPGNLTGLLQVWGSGPDLTPCNVRERFWPQSLKVMLRLIRPAATTEP